jgi:hypothetical protein
MTQAMGGIPSSTSGNPTPHQSQVGGNEDGSGCTPAATQDAAGGGIGEDAGEAEECVCVVRVWLCACVHFVRFVFDRGVNSLQGLRLNLGTLAMCCVCLLLCRRSSGSTARYASASRNGCCRGSRYGRPDSGSVPSHHGLPPVWHSSSGWLYTCFHWHLCPQGPGSPCACLRCWPSCCCHPCHGSTRHRPTPRQHSSSGAAAADSRAGVRRDAGCGRAHQRCSCHAGTVPGTAR